MIMVTALNSLLERLVEQGSALEVKGLGLLLPAVLEIHDKRLFWVPQFAMDQHYAHALPFDRTQAVGEVGLGFYQDEVLVAYLAPYIEWPELDYNAAWMERVRWLDYLKDEKQRTNWEEFVARCRKDVL